MGTLLQDVKFSLRALYKRPGFTAVAVLTLAIGIGATTAIFSVVRSTLLRPLPFAEPETLMQLNLLVPAAEVQFAGSPEMVWSFPKYEILQKEQTSFSEVAAYTGTPFTLTGTGEAERLEGEVATASYFRVLRLQPRVGRTFAPEEDTPGGPAVALIGEGLWNRRFNADPSTVGRKLIINGEPVTVIGVLPAGFAGLSGRAEVWMPVASLGAEDLSQKWSHFLDVVGRRKAGLTIERATEEMRLLGARIEAAIPDRPNAGKWGATARDLNSLRIDPAIRRSVLVLFGAVAMVLLIACVNVANLLLTRSAGRRREIAVRLAIGASRARLARQLLTEGLVLAVVGGAVGILLGTFGVQLLSVLVKGIAANFSRQLGGLSIVSLNGVQLDGTVLLFAAGATIITGLFFGAAPALQAARSSLTGDLKDGPAFSGAGRAPTVRNVLAAAEVALAFVLLVGAGLMLRSLSRLLDTDAGFDASNVLTMRLAVPPAGDRPPIEFWDAVTKRLSALPGVEHTGIGDCPPLAGGCNQTVIWFRDRPAVPEGSEPRVGVHFASPDYFRALRVPVLQGRVFEPRDRTGAPKVVVINQAAAEKFYPNQNPVGHLIAVGQGGFHDRAEIIGVVGNQRFATIEQPPIPDVYISYSQATRRSGMVYIRTAGEQTGLMAAVRREVRAIDANAPIYDIMSMDQRVGVATARTRISGLLLTAFAGIALALALVGIYGVMAYAVTQRTREIGIRMTLGADRGNIAALVVRSGARIAFAGLAVGLAGAMAGSRVLQSLLFEVEPADPVTFAVLTAVVAITTLTASLIPALRAARVDPLIAVKSD